MEFTLPVSLGVLFAVVIVGLAGLAGSGVMATTTVLTMVAPSMVAFGVLAFWLGVKHGEFRTG